MTAPFPTDDPEDGAPPQRVRWSSAAAWRLHATLVAGLALSAGATWLEWTRAHAGHPVAWVYTFEWPLFALLGTCLWWRLLHAEQPSSQRRDRQPPAGGDESEPDLELLAWQAYLERLHRTDPPGGPPSGRR